MTVMNQIALATAERAVQLIGTDLTERSLRRTWTACPASTRSASSSGPPASAPARSRPPRRPGRSTRIIELIDLTTLEGADTPGKVRSLVAKAMTPDPADPTCPRVAAVCVYGDMVPYAVEALGAAHGDPDDGLASRSPPSPRRSRAGAHRSRSSSPTRRTPSPNGADEIDMVIDRGAFLSGRYGLVFDQIVAVKEACRRADGTYAHLKVILETGELNTYDNVRRASWLAILAGGDFIKTSTGKVAPAATLPVTLLMLRGRARLAPR